jgi:3-oxoacyl-[acyl-carrier protein] reductase
VLLDVEGCAETVEQVEAAGSRAFYVSCDVTSEQDWQNASAYVEEKFGRADILINNAGIYPYAEFDDLTPALYRKVMAVNLEGPFLGAKAFVPLMKKNKWGRIVNISSNSIGTSLPGFSHYMASKMGVIGFTRGLANDLGEHGITVNAVAPAITRTPGASAHPEEMTTAVWMQQAIRRYAGPQDIVGPIVFLTTDDAEFITGQTIVVDGGMLKI